MPTMSRAARLLLGFAALGASAAGAQNVTEFPLPTAKADPFALAARGSGELWFTESAAQKIGRITTAGAVTEFPLANIEALPFALALGPDGNLWFTEMFAGKIGRITPAGAVTEFAIPTVAAVPYGITAGPDGKLWFVEQVGNRIGRISTAGVVSEFPVFDHYAGLTGITRGPDGNVWFIEQQAGKIGRITVAGVVTEFDIPTSSAAATAIATGPDGNLWFAESAADKIGRITPAGVVTEFALPTSSAGLAAVTGGADGNVWFTENKANKVGRITPAGVITEFPLPTADARPTGIALGPDGKIWFVEGNGNAIARFDLSAPASCLPSATVLCLSGQTGDNRFEIKLHYQTSQGSGLSGEAKAIPLSSLGVNRGGQFYFTDATNPEVLLKILNGCGINQKFWVFYAAGTNLGFTVTVRDTRTGATRTYTNPDLHNADPKQDTAAFACAAADVAAVGRGAQVAVPEGREILSSVPASSLAPLGEASTGTTVIFPATAPAGIATVSCYGVCFGAGTGCSGGGTLTLDDGLAPPFSIANLRKTSNLSSCSGTPVAGFPVNLASGQQLLFDLVFQPSQKGTFSDALTVSGFTIPLSGTTNGSSIPVSFNDTEAGSSASRDCYYVCFGADCSSPGTLILRQGLAAPFSVRNLRRTTSASSCDGAAVAGFPVALAAGERLLMDFRFAPAAAGDFARSLVLNNFAFDLSGTATPAPPPTTNCGTNPKVLCIQNRFKVKLSYTTTQGGGLSGQATPIPLTTLGVTRGGLFYFTDPTNPEMLVKVLDGCGINQKTWVFFSATTNLGFTLTVTDTATGVTKTYPNADLHPAAPINDTVALKCQ